MPTRQIGGVADATGGWVTSFNYDGIPDQHDPSSEFDPGRVPRLPRSWDGGRALLFFILTAVLSIMLGVALLDPVGFYGSIVIAEVVGFAVLPYLLRRLFDIGWDRWLAPLRIAPAFYGWGALAIVGFALVQSNIPVLIDRVYPIPTEQYELYRTYLSAATPWEYVLFVLVAAIVPAICEEISFRGVIQTGLRNSFGPRAAVIWTGFLFAVLHMNIWNFLGLWVFGCLLGYLAERSGSIRPAILFHMLNNSLALAVFAMQSPEEWAKPVKLIPWYWTLLGGVVLIASLVRLHRITRPLEPVPEAADIP